MTKIIFTLQDDTPAGEISASLKEICSLSELFNVRAVFPEVQDKGLRNLYAAEVAEGPRRRKRSRKSSRRAMSKRLTCLLSGGRCNQSFSTLYGSSPRH